MDIQRIRVVCTLLSTRLFLFFQSAFFAIVLLGILMPVTAHVQAVTPTPQQIEQFKRLPESQQKALAAEYGISLDALNAPQQQAPITDITTVKPRDPNADLSLERLDDTETALGREEKSRAERQFDEELSGNAGGEIEDEKEQSALIEKQDEPLKPFGYELFAGTPTTFAPATDIPVPVDYVVGPGDTVMIQLYGKENSTYELVVNREGVIQFPEIGPLTVAGMTFKELKEYLLSVVSEQMIGVKASVTMGALRSIRVFVLGEAHRPGSYTVSALSTITNALFVSGGLTSIGSLRNVQLKRSGEVIVALDLYDLLLNGDTRNDQRLLPGDVIFIPPVGTVAGVSGEIKRPALYELKNEKTLADLVQLAGGYTPEAYPQASRVQRIDRQGNRTILDVDLTRKRGKQTLPNDGDALHIYSVLDKMENVVALEGHVYREGGFAWRKGLRVSDIIRSQSELLPNPDLKYALIKREIQPSRTIKVVPFSLKNVLNNPRSKADPVLLPKDEILVFGVEEEREELLEPINLSLRSQAGFNAPPNIVSIEGHVRFPGEYPYTDAMRVGDLIAASSDELPNIDRQYAVLVKRVLNTGKIRVESLRLDKEEDFNKRLDPEDRLLVFGLNTDRQELLEPVIQRLMLQADHQLEQLYVSIGGQVRFPGTYPLVRQMSVDDLVQAAGGFNDRAFGMHAELTRAYVSENEQQEYERLDLYFDPETALAMQDYPLQSRDQVFIKQIPNWNELATAEITGEVMFPGKYPIYKGDTIRDLVLRAGGLTEFGSANGAVFLRDSLREREEKQLERFRLQLQRDLAALKLSTGAQSSEEALELFGGDLLSKLDNVRAAGRLVIDLPALLENELHRSNVGLKDGDQLVVPPLSNAVSVLGEVQFPTAHIYRGKSNVFDYIDVSGGVTSNGDKGRIYVIKENGEIQSVKRTLWILYGSKNVDAGDTVVVPYDIGAAGRLAYWTGVSQVLFNLATTVAALETVGAF